MKTDTRYEITKGCQYDRDGACLIAHGRTMAIESFSADGERLAGDLLGGTDRDQILAAVRATIADGVRREITVAAGPRAAEPAISDESWITDSRYGFAEGRS